MTHNKVKTIVTFLQWYNIKLNVTVVLTLLWVISVPLSVHMSNLVFAFSTKSSLCYSGIYDAQISLPFVTQVCSK